MIRFDNIRPVTPEVQTDVLAAWEEQRARMFAFAKAPDEAVEAFQRVAWERFSLREAERQQRSAVRKASATPPSTARATAAARNIDRRARIVDLYNVGVEPEHLAERFGVTVGAINQVLLAAGIRRRDR
jgi:hypothetical protein